VTENFLYIFLIDNINLLGSEKKESKRKSKMFHHLAKERPTIHLQKYIAWHNGLCARAPVFVYVYVCVCV